MIIFKWNITGLMIDRDAIDGKRDRVIEVSWELVGTDEATGITALRYGTQPLGDPLLHAVVREMTPGRVTDWLLATFTPDTIHMLKDRITTSIEKQIDDPHYQVTAPWRVKDEPEAGGPDVVSDPPTSMPL